MINHKSELVNALITARELLKKEQEKTLDKMRAILKQQEKIKNEQSMAKSTD